MRCEPSETSIVREWCELRCCPSGMLPAVLRSLLVPPQIRDLFAIDANQPGGLDIDKVLTKRTLFPIALTPISIGADRFCPQKSKSLEKLRRSV